MNEQEPTYEQLIAFAAGELAADDPAAAAQLQAKLNASPHLARELETVVRVLETMRRDTTVLPPELLVERAVALLRAGDHQSPARSPISHAVAVVLELVYDSRQPQAFAGVRGHGDSYHLTFAGDDAEVDLQVSPTADRPKLRVVGQVTAGNGAGAPRLRLLRRESGETVHTSWPDDTGLFRLTIEPGLYNLEIDMKARALRIDDLDLA